MSTTSELNMEIFGTQQVPLLSSRQLAPFLRRSHTTVAKLQQQGILHYACDENGMPIAGRYDLLEAVGDFCNYLDIQIQKKSETTDLDAQKLRELRAKADIAEMKAAEMLKDYHAAKDIERLVNAHVAACKKRMLRILAEFTEQIVDMSDVCAVESVLTDAVYAALDDMRKWRPDEA